MIRRFVFAFVIGFLSHRTRDITKNMPDGWRNLTDHTIGVITLSPAIIIWWRFLHWQPFADDDQVEREILAAIGLAAIGYGAGNAVAWVVDAITEKI